MGTIPLATFLGFAAACAPGVAPETLAAIARVESGFDALVIGVNERGVPPVRSTTAADATAKARSLIAQGRSIDLGLMQINSRNLGWLGLSIEGAFDPCRSVAAGARVLTAFSGYNTGSPHRGFTNGYVARVLAAGATNGGTSLSAHPSPAPLPGPVPAACVPSWDVWARCPAAAPASRDPDPADADEQAPPSAEPVRLRGSLAMGADTR